MNKEQWYIINGDYVVTICDSRYEAFLRLLEEVDKSISDKKTAIWYKARLSNQYSDKEYHPARIGAPRSIYAKRKDCFGKISYFSWL